MQRRQFLKTTGLALSGMLLNGTHQLTAPVRAASGRPLNFIVIMADDLGAKELGCYGNTKHLMPNLNRLAQTGMQFKTCYATPICHPTRFEIMTGQYGHNNGVFHFAGRRGGPKPGSPEDDISRQVTFAQVLKPLG